MLTNYTAQFNLNYVTTLSEMTWTLLSSIYLIDTSSPLLGGCALNALGLIRIKERIMAKAAEHGAREIQFIAIKKATKVTFL